MARRSVASSSIGSLKLGDSFQGYYLGAREVSTNTGEKSVHDFISYRDQKLWSKKDGVESQVDIAKGEQVALWGTTVLNDLLRKGVGTGDWCEVTFKEERPTKKGNPAKIFDVVVDDEIKPLGSEDMPASSEPAAKPENVAAAGGSLEDDLPF